MIKNQNFLPHNYIFQLLKFLDEGKEKKDIIFLFANCNNMSSQVLLNVEFCQNFLEYLPQANGEFINTRICFYQYYQNCSALVGGWSSSKVDVQKALGSILYFILNFI